MSLAAIVFVMAVILAGACVQSALGFGTTMITMGFLPLIMDYSKAMGLSIVMVSISTVYISVKYRNSIQWGIMMPFLIPTAVICGAVNILSARVGSDLMYLLLGFMFVAVSVFFFVFSNRIHVRPTPKAGMLLGVIGCVYPFLPEKLEIIPDFQEERFNCNLFARGHLFLVYVIVYIVKIIRIEEIRELIKTMNVRRRKNG